MTDLRATYRKSPKHDGRWEGVLKDRAGKVVWCCGHAHENRDYNHSRWYAATGAALYCAKDELKRRNTSEAA